MTDQDVERWKKLVADFETSDLTQREFASERGISFSNLRNWIYRLQKESRPLVEVAPESSGQVLLLHPPVWCQNTIGANGHDLGSPPRLMGREPYSA